MTQETYFVLVLVDHRTVDVSVPRTDRRLDLIARPSRVNSCSQPSVPFTLQGTRTAFSTSLGFESQVPKPIWGILWPLERVTYFP